MPDVGAKLLRDKQQRLIEKQDKVTLAKSPITKLARSVTQSGIPSVSVAVGLSLLTGDWLTGLAILGELEGGAAFETQLREGGSVLKAGIIGELSGAAEIGGEMLVFPKFVRGIKEGISLRKALTLIAENTLQEGVTGFNQRFLEVFGIETSKGMSVEDAARLALNEGVKAIPENAWVGGATAGFVDVISIGTGRLLTKRVPQEELSQRLQQRKGISKELADEAARMVHEENVPIAEADRMIEGRRYCPKPTPRPKSPRWTPN